MRTLARGIIGLVVAHGTAAITACDKQPSGAPAPVASVDSSTTRYALKPAPPPPRKLPRPVSPQAMKVHRIDSCYFGALGLRAARDGYAQSLSGAVPGPGHLPGFGSWSKPPTKEKTEAQRASAVAPPWRPLPFSGLIRACTLAKAVKQPADPELDTALAKFEKYAGEVAKLINAADRYYQRKEYEKDQFAGGKKLHQQLTTAFAELDKRLDAFGKAVRAWRSKLGPAPDELDATGKLAAQAIEKARALVSVFAVERIDVKQLEKSRSELASAIAELKKQAQQDATAPHGRQVPAHLDKLLQAVDQLKDKIANKTLTNEDRFGVFTCYLTVLRWDNRALLQLVRGNRRRGGAKAKHFPGTLRPDRDDRSAPPVNVGTASSP